MPALTTQTVLESGLTATYENCDAGGDTFENDGKTILHVKNGDSSPHTPTIAPSVATTRKPGFGSLTKASASSAVANASEDFIGPFPVAAFGVNPTITYDDVTSMTIAVIRL